MDLNILKDASEIVHYDNFNIPIYIKESSLSAFTNMSALCHWHTDIEYLKVTRGHMSYFVNGEIITIKENDAVIVNSKQMHYGFSGDKTDSRYYCVLFKPEIISNTDEIKVKYIDPIITGNHISFIYLNAEEASDAEIIHIFDEIYKIGNEKQDAYEMHLVSQLNYFWYLFYHRLKEHVSFAPLTVDDDLKLQKQMVEFIYQNYQDKITLNDIAQAGEICRSKCCKIFKKYLSKSPIDFLNTYRLEVSMTLLMNSSFNITEVAFLCGFHNPSYFTENFTRYKGCSPSEYRKMQQ